MSYVDIVVVRGAGDKEAPSISSLLLNSTQVAIYRGAVEINDSASTIKWRLTSVFYREGLRLGMLAAIVDVTRGVTWLARITGIAHSFTQEDMFTDITLGGTVEPA